VYKIATSDAQLANCVLLQANLRKLYVSTAREKTNSPFNELA